MWFGSHFFFFNLQKSFLKWLNRSSRNYTALTAYPCGTKGSRLWHHVTWFGSHIGFTLKPSKILSRTSGQMEGKCNINVFQALGISGNSQIIERSHGLAAIFDWMKIFFFNDFSWTASSINVKLQNYDLLVMMNIYFKFQPDRSRGLAARII